VEILKAACSVVDVEHVYTWQEGVAEEVALVAAVVAVEVPEDTPEATSTTTTVAAGGRTATSVPLTARGAY
jgi:hypothetical protein